MVRALVVLAASTFIWSTRAFTPVSRAKHSFNADISSQIASPTRLLATDGGGTSMRPLYDGTNYTFPDTASPDGIAELLEVSFVNACLQLRTGFVDVLKLFIATAVSGYELGYSIDAINRALAECKTESANRALAPEEVNLRRVWVNVVYLMLASIDHSTRNALVSESIEDDVRNDFGDLISSIAQNKKDGIASSVEQIMAQDTSQMTAMEQAIKSQSLRVATLTLVVLQDSELSREHEAVKPPNPPIEGAF